MILEYYAAHKVLGRKSDTGSMSVSSIGPFQSVSMRDLPDIDNITDEITESSKATSGVKPDAEADDSTQDQDNRGFIQILDYMARQEKKKQRESAHHILFNDSRKRERVILKYHSLNHFEDDLAERGQVLNKAV